MKKVLALLAGAALALTAGTASAHLGADVRLRFFFGDTGSVSWQTGVHDSPLDENHARVKFNVPEQTGDDYAGAYARGTGLAHLPVADVRNLSFDFLLGPDDTGGGVRFSIPIDENNNGDEEGFVFAAARDCAEPILGSDWQRADFTGRTTVGCTIYYKDGIYSSTGTQSAWDVFAAANPTFRIARQSEQVAFVVLDEVGTVFLDRIAFERHMFVKPGTGAQAIIHCPFESSC